jgi:hypothetical protein
MVAMGLATDGEFSAEDAGFCWDDSDMFAVVDVVQIEEQSKSRRAGRAARPMYDAKRWASAEYRHGHGTEGWMERPRMTPEALFAERCHAGNMPTGDEFVEHLEQFARIKECQWARTMLAGLADPDDVEYDLSTYNPDRPDLWLKQVKLSVVCGRA